MHFDQKVKQQYSGEKGKEYHDALNLVPDIAYPWVARLRKDKIKKFISENDVVLEYGVGTGWNISELKCKRKIGHDISEHLVTILEKNNIEFVKDISVIPDESIDVVICHHVLEHTGNPPDVLREIRRILRNEGKLLLFVPYEKGKKYHRYDPQEPNHHLYSWNVQTLGNLLEQADFTVINGFIRPFGYDRFSGVWAARLHLGEFGFRFLRRLIHRVKPVFEVFLVAAKR